MRPGELDAYTVYVFVRQDIPLEQQLVQANHATFTMALQSKPADGSPNIIVVGVPHAVGLKRVLNKLENNAIPSETFEDPDFAFGPTAVATYPLDAEAKKPLSNYRLWRYVPPVAAQVAAAFDGKGGATSHADVAQTRRESANGEHPLSKREVIGGSPIVSSSSTTTCLS